MALSSTDVQSAVDQLFATEVQLLQDLIRFQSLVGQPGEKHIQDFLCKYLQEDVGLKEVHKWEVTMEEIQGKPNFSPVFGEWKDKLNVVGIHRPSSSPPVGKSLIFNGHVDVVPTGPVDLWTHDPFNPVIDGDWLYGRGSGDMKAGIAAMIFAFKALKHLGYQPASEVQFHCVTDEECTGNGALGIIQKGYKADACVIPEPLPFIMTAQLGVLWLHLEVTGRPAHVWDTSAGVNSIEGAMALYATLKELCELWNEAEVRHPFYKDLKHPINFNLGRIEGGEWGSTVPSRCKMTIRVGFFPGLEASDVQRQLETYIEEKSKVIGVSCKISYSGFVANGCTIDSDSELVTYLSRAYRAAAVSDDDAPLSAACCTTDARFYQLNAGIPTTCFGPKSVRNVHGIDEKVSLQSLKDVTKVLAMFLIDWCGVEPVTPQDGASPAKKPRLQG